MLKQQNPRLRAATLSRLSPASIEVAYRDNKQVAPAWSKSRARDPLAPIEIWGQYNNYRSTGLKGSVAIHAVLIGLLLASAAFGHRVVEQTKPRQVVTLIAPSPDSYTMTPSKKEVSGGGGGGDHDVMRAPKGRLPKLALQQITPPAIVLHNEKPKLVVQPTVVVPPQVHLAENHAPSLGIPSALPLPSAPPSNGTGSGGGIGSGSGGGVGVGHGPGVGTGSGGGIGGGVYKVGGGITAPRPIDTPDPTYTEQARQAKIEGTCVLGLIVDADGHPRDLRVIRGLGYGLDEKALEAVKQWRFQPARKDGQPVNVQVSVEVAFRLY
jgi:periplasmic protein TonB